MDIERTKAYYAQISERDLCQCEYCRNYVHEIRAACPKVTEYLASLGIDIEKPFETMPIEPDQTGHIEYISGQYVAYGKPDDFVKTVIRNVSVDLTGTHPSTGIDEAHFVIEIAPIRLKWVL